MSNGINSLAHYKWECKFHVVWIPKYLQRGMYGSIRQYLGKIFRSIAERIGLQYSRRACVRGPCSYADRDSTETLRGACFVGFINGKSAVAIARNFLGKRQNFTGQRFWARGYFVSTVGRDEEMIKQYIEQ